MNRVAGELIDGVVDERGGPGGVEQKAIIDVVVHQVVGGGIVGLKMNTDGVAVDGVAIDGGIVGVNTVAGVVGDAIVRGISKTNVNTGSVVVHDIADRSRVCEGNPSAVELIIDRIARDDNIKASADPTGSIVVNEVAFTGLRWIGQHVGIANRSDRAQIFNYNSVLIAVSSIALNENRSGIFEIESGAAVVKGLAVGERIDLAKNPDAVAAVVIRAAKPQRIDRCIDADSVTTVVVRLQLIESGLRRVGLDNNSVATIARENQRCRSESDTLIVNPETSVGAYQAEICQGHRAGVIQLDVRGVRIRVSAIESRGVIGRTLEGGAGAVADRCVPAQDDIANFDIVAGVDIDGLSWTEIVGSQERDQIRLGIFGGGTGISVISNGRFVFISDGGAVVDVIGCCSDGDREGFAGVVDCIGVVVGGDPDHVVATGIP